MELLTEFSSGVVFGLGLLTGVLVGASILGWFLWRTLKRGAAAIDVVVNETCGETRIARITDLAVRVFGNQRKAMRWLNKPKARLNGLTPVQACYTEIGIAQVEEMLVQLDEGMAS